MSATFDQAVALLTGAGQPFEITDAEVAGVSKPVFKNAPGSLRALFMATRAHGDKTSVVYENERYSFAEVMANADALGATLAGRYGVRKGDRVAIAMRNYPEWVMSFIAVTSIGAISVSLNSWWTADELAFALGDSSPSVLIADDQRMALSADTCRRLGTRMIAVRSAAGTGSDIDRWEDVVSMRLNGSKAVINEGIGGNTITREGLKRVLPPAKSVPRQTPLQSQGPDLGHAAAPVGPPRCRSQPCLHRFES